MVVRVVDIETTGTDPATAKIVEIASIDLGRGGEIVARQSHLCNPGIPIPPETSEVHHIIDADVKDKPHVSEIIGMYQGADLFVAHNAAFEQSFLHQLLGAPKWYCTMKAALRIWPEAPNHKNNTLRYWRGHFNPLGQMRSTIDAHRALSDCIVTGALFCDLSGAAPWAEQMKWQAEPPLYSKFSFGMHKGKRLEDEPGYLRWIIDKSDMDEGWKFSARYWLDKRGQQAA
jgi:exodeoxyribonuclease X